MTTLMIRDVFVSANAVSPGGAFDLQVEADGDIAIALHCFRRSPPPPRLVPCGHIIIATGDTIRMVADPQHFPSGSSGELRLELRDCTDGNSRHLVIAVSTTDSATGAPDRETPASG